jgi:hypothetical protein
LVVVTLLISGGVLLLCFALFAGRKNNDPKISIPSFQKPGKLCSRNLNHPHNASPTDIGSGTPRGEAKDHDDSIIYNLQHTHPRGEGGGV